MKIEEVIKQLESILDHVCSMAASPDADDIWRKDIDALKFALAALRSMPEAGEPLSLEQLKQMDGKPVWCEDVERLAIVSVSDAGKWKDIPFALFEKNDARFEWNVEDRELSLYSYPPPHIDRSKWISVKERLPDDEKDGETVLAIVSGKPHKNITLCHALMTAGYFPGEGWVVNEYPEWENPTITHWMPLPEPPEEG